MRQYKNNITSSIRNITLISKNITPYFTGKIKIITLTSLIIILSFINITFTYALSYQTYQRLDFTFNPTLQLALSSTELTIPNLTPGASSDSNVINIGVATNTFGGLNLAATVGNSTNDTTSLVSHIDNNNPSNNSAFTNLSTSATTLNDLPNNTWGYSYASRNTSANPDAAWSNWNSYNGLIKYDDTTSTPSTLLDTTGTAISGEVQFKIGAKASSAQPSGTYTNVINFNATTKPLTTTYTINYLDNTGEASSSLPPSATDTIVADTNITLSSTIPTRLGSYTFIAWCTAVTSSDACPGNIYQPGETYPISNIGEPVTINLYAMWQGPKLYDVVASKVKTDAGGNPRTQTLADLQAVITVPTSNDPATDTSNSGVYLYNGASSDVDNGYNIYYYRGILDSDLDGTQNTYGSNGDGYYYPNYVRLGDTCWRIVRTTASGGVKMIYNGLYSSGTTANSCANAQNNAQITSTSKAFGIKASSTLDDWYRNINRVGYTFNNDPSIQDNTAPMSVGIVFGDNSNYNTINNTDSNIKDYIENTWFTSANGISQYESILEPSAGYCNDRTIYSNASTAPTAVTEMPPYATSGTRYFGASERNQVNGATLSLFCSRTTDLYTVSNAIDGNKQLTHPVALLTADESALAGSGYGGLANISPNSSNYSHNSYLRSDSSFWLFSPNTRYFNGWAYEFVLARKGDLSGSNVSYGAGVRPAISLMHHIQISSGSGTATDPYLISAP